MWNRLRAGTLDVWLVLVLGGAVLLYPILLTGAGRAWHIPPSVARGASVPMMRFLPTDDVSVSNYRTNLSGTSTFLLVEASPTGITRTFLKFRVSDVTLPVASAKILLRSTKSSPQGGTLARVSSHSWSEATATWRNQPAIDGPVLGSVGAVRSTDYYEWDVTRVVKGNGRYSFAFACTSCASRYNSSEAGGNRPYLIVVFVQEPLLPIDAPSDPVLVGAGDIASCASAGDEATARLLDDIPGIVFTAGDNAYPNGSPGDFLNCYDFTWGRHLDRTRPAVGNHEYGTSGAVGYFWYFGEVAGDPAEGYYSYDLGTWHIVVLNSNCSKVGGCNPGSPQDLWLRDDLEANPKECTLAYWHHPRFSSGQTHGSQLSMRNSWRALYDAHADVVIGGHDHLYERFAPQDPNGVTDLIRGIREFVVGTGGFYLYKFATPIANSEVRNNTTYGVLKLVLHPTRYEWEFIPITTGAFADSGEGGCH